MKTRLSKDQLISLIKKVRLNPKKDVSLETAYYRDFIQVSSLQVPRDLFLYPLNSRKFKESTNLFSTVVQVLEKLARHITFLEPSLLDYLMLNALDLEAAKSRGADFLYTYCRVDSIFDGKNYRVIEVNANRPQLYEDIDWMTSYFNQHLGFEREEVSYEIVRAMKSTYQHLHNKEPENIVLVSNHLNLLWTKKSYGTYFHKALQKVFPKSKVITITTSDLPELNSAKYKNGALVFKDKRVDLIIIQDNGTYGDAFFTSGQINSKQISQAYHNKDVEIISPPSASIVGSKLALTLILNKEIQTKLNLKSEEKDALNLLAKSAVVTDLMQINFAEKEKLVFKVPYVGHGTGIYLGSEYTTGRLKELLSRELEYTKVIQIQDRVNPGVQKIIDIQSRREVAAIVTLDPFFVKSASTGKPVLTEFYTRAIKNSFITKNSKFNPMFSNPEVMVGAVAMVLTKT